MVGDAATTLASNLGDAASNLGVVGGSRFDGFPSWIDVCVHGCIDYIIESSNGCIDRIGRMRIDNCVANRIYPDGWILTQEI